MAVAVFPDGVETPKVVGGHVVASALDLRPSDQANYTGPINCGKGGSNYGPTSPSYPAAILLNLWPDGATFGGASVGGASIRGVSLASTLIQSADAVSGLPAYNLFAAFPTLKPSSSAITALPLFIPFVYGGTILNNTSSTLSASGLEGLRVSPTLSNTGTGTLSLAWAVLAHSVALSVSAGVTLTANRGVWMEDASGAGTITEQIAVEIGNLTKGGTNLSMRSVGSAVQMRHAGPGVFGANAAPTNASCTLEVQTTTGAFVPPRLTTVERDALTAVNGMMVYNTTLGVMQSRNAGVWTSL